MNGRPLRHILRELGFQPARVGDEMHGSAAVRPEMWVPGTSSLRTSILAAWTDMATGYLAVDLLAPRVPVTLELDVHLFQPLPGDGAIHAVARTLKAGRAVSVLTVDFTDGAGEPLAAGSASFMAAPDPGLTMPTEDMRRAAEDPAEPLTVPFAERALCERREPGVAVLHRSDEGMNASQTVNGGLVALAVEEAALSAARPGASVASLSMRYLRPVRLGPAVATAAVIAGLARVEVRDAGSEDRLAVVATARAFGG